MMLTVTDWLLYDVTINGEIGESSLEGGAAGGEAEERHRSESFCGECDPSTLWAATAAELWLASVCFVGGAIWCFCVTLNSSLFALWNTAVTNCIFLLLWQQCHNTKWFFLAVAWCNMLIYLFTSFYWPVFYLCTEVMVVFRAAPSLHWLCTTECRSVVVYTCLLLSAVFCTINKPRMQHRGVYSFRWEAAAPNRWVRGSDWLGHRHEVAHTETRGCHKHVVKLWHRKPLLIGIIDH